MSESHGHIVPLWKYYLVFAALAVLLVLTLVAARLEFGRLNIVIAMGIAALKALLIVLYFMHVRYSAPLIRVVAFGGLLWLCLATLLTFSDYLTRGWVEYPHLDGAPRYQPSAVDRLTPSGDREPAPGPDVNEPR